MMPNTHRSYPTVCQNAPGTPRWALCRNGAAICGKDDPFAGDAPTHISITPLPLAWPVSTAATASAAGQFELGHPVVGGGRRVPALGLDAGIDDRAVGRRPRASGSRYRGR